MTTGGKKNLTLVKPNNPLFVPPERSGLFHEDLTDTPPAGAFQSGLPEKSIEVPGPLVQQAIARAIAGLSESQAFQAMDTTQMAKVNRLAHKVPKDVVKEDQVDAEQLLGEDEAQGKTKTNLEGRAEDKDKHNAEDNAEQALTAEEPATESKAAEEEGTASELMTPEASTASMEVEPEEAELREALPTDESQGASQDESPSTQAAEEQPQGLAEADSTKEPLQAEGEQAEETSGATGEREALDASEAVEGAEGAEAAEVSEVSDASDASEAPEPEALQQVSRSDLEQLHQEAFEAGRQAALDELANAAPPPPSEEMLEAAREEAFQKGYEEGYSKAEAAVKDELQAEVELAAQSLNDFTAKLAEAARDTNAFYAPLLNLSMHLAEQLVRGELTLSSKAIQRLIETCLMEFEQEATAPVVVRMHPDDLALLEQDEALLPKNMILRPDPHLLIGSVKVQMNGALIEDLMAHRGQVLWQALMQGQEVGDLPDSFLRNVALVKEAFDEVASPEAEESAEDALTLDEPATQEAVSEPPVLADVTETVEVDDDAKKGEAP